MLSHKTRITAHSLTVICVCITLTDRQTINTMKMTNAHAHYFLVNNVLLLPNLKAFAQLTRSLHASRNAPCFQSGSSCRTVCRCHQSLYLSVSHSQHPRTTSDTPSQLSGSSLPLRKHCYKCKVLT